MAKFATSARAVDMLGRQQIAGVPTAISELFKNAYDAYATEVRADYIPSQRLFLLRDNGVGMSELDFQTRWLTLATDSKARNSMRPPPPRPADALPRPTMGEKGIGRLAVATLGPVLLVITRPIHVKDHEPGNLVVALIPWSMFEIPGLVLDDVHIPQMALDNVAEIDSALLAEMVERVRANLRRVKTSVPPELYSRIRAELDSLKFDPQAFLRLPGPSLAGEGHGTTFMVMAASEDIDAALTATERERAEDSATPLERLLIGFMDTMLPGRPSPEMRARFVLHSPEREPRDLIDPEAFWTPKDFRSLDHDISGTFDEYGRFQGSVSIYQQEPVACDVQWPQGKGRLSRCGPFTLRLGYIQGNARESRLDPQTYGVMSRKLSRFGGLYIYRDGIRVQPYGSVDVDYLRIEERRSRRASRYYFSYRRMFGAIEVSSIDNADLQDKASREGLRENGAFRDFRAILENFFIELASDYFNAGGDQSEDWQQYRQQLRDTDQLRKEMDARRRRAGSDYQARLDAALDYLEDGALRRDVGQLLQAVKARLANGPLDAAELTDLEESAREQLGSFLAKAELQPAPDLGLTPDQRRDLVAHEALFREARTGTIPRAAKQLADLIDEASTKDAHLAIVGARQRYLQESAKAVQKSAAQLRADTERSTTELTHLLARTAREVIHGVDLASHQAQQSLVLATTEDDRQAVVKRLTAVSESELGRLRHLKAEIDAILTGRSLAENVLLQEQVLDLQQQVDANLELLLLGQAVQVIDHELEASVQAARLGLRRLRALARQDQRLVSALSDTTSAFEHLDGYLRLFTPMQRRLYRRRTSITGDSIANFVSRVFHERLMRHEVELEVSPSFRDARIQGFPSTFLPVFVNVVDNALYWLAGRGEGHRRIALDVDGSSFVIADNGPGVRERDRTAIFDRGFSRKPAGRGIGLAISREALEREQPPWTLELAEVQPDRGAAFHIRPGRQLDAQGKTG